MKNIIYLLTVTLISCDLPQRSIQGDINIIDSGTGSSSGIDYGTNPTDPGASVVVGYETCNDSYTFNGGSFGRFSLCRHATDSQKFKTRFETAFAAGICFIPTHRLSSGESFKLGIAECVYNQSDKDYFMELNKELGPPSYTSPRTEQINGVMVMESTLVGSYMACMNAKQTYLLAARQQPSNPYSAPCCYSVAGPAGNQKCIQVNSACEQAANSHAAGVCSSFVNNARGRYKEVYF